PKVHLYTTGKVMQNNQPLPMYTLLRLNEDCQGLSVSNEYKDLPVGVDSSALKEAFARKKAAGKEVKVAMTFPGGTHDVWIRYWLAAGGIDPDKDVSTIVVPPPQMVANMKVGTMDAFCVGEPWNEQLVNQDIGFTAATTGEVWFKVPESIKFIYKGKLGKWLSGKDLILYTIGQIGVDGALYCAMEFTGPVIEKLDMDGRFSMSNMAIEAGARAGIIEPDEITWEYVAAALKNERSKIKLSSLKARAGKMASDRGAHYAKIYEWDVSGLEPQVACPHLPSNVKPVSALKSIVIDQVVIGSCTNGRISDLRAAAKILKGRKVKAGMRLIVIPATQKIYREAIEEGLVETFIKAGGIVSTPTCGPCLGGHAGILTEGETCLATTNRNFIGRMGSPKSFVYLSNPAVAAASAVTGRITHPHEVV
ncbi:MAG TPA: aconitase/3-isopropylmalate dehydratase large subunit family protein, partial [Candidatus Omnitrophota bacterium]|nr:aconitase/3-isopropylmalate dehydratase large subunit family protein [Candidatus Omnitrophota bacterium]